MTLGRARRVLASAAAGLMTLVLIPPAAAEPQSNHAILTPGQWSLARLGYQDIKITSSTPQQAVAITLPRGAEQGPTRWWQIFLHARVSFLPHARGISYHTAKVNGAASASVMFDLDQGPNGGMAWNTVDVNGQVDHESATHAVDFTFSNYVQVAGIRPGPSTISFDLESLSQSISSSLDSVEIFSAGSGLIWNSDGPDDLSLEVAPPLSPPSVGQLVRIRYTVKNADTKPATNIKLSIEIVDSGLSLAGPPLIPVAAVIGSRSGEFEIRTTAKGTQRMLVKLLTDGHRTRDGKLVRFDVAAARSWATEYILLATLAVAFVVGCLLVTGVRRNRCHQSSP